ncbi:MAG: ABC transporter permease [Clostridia bacterium]|nr:ABC transporter permease [Clostridia bacterium]
MTKNFKERFLIPAFNTLLPVISALFLGGIIIFAIGDNPFKTYGVMISKSLFTVDGILKTLHFASPLILTGLAIAITFKANVFNMGVEGQMLLGAFFSGVFGFSFDLPPLLHISLCLIVGVITGILFALIPAFLKAFFKVNEMVVTLMLNYAAVEITRYLAQGVFRNPASGDVATYTINSSAMFNKVGKNITAFFLISILVFIFIYILMKKSKLGYEITAIGKNEEFAKASGMRVYRKIIYIMMISGGISGLAGAGWMMSEKYRYTTSFSGNPGIGWDGMLIALLGAHNPVGVLIAAIFYAALKTGSDYINLYTNVPKDIVGVIQGILILFLSIKFINDKTDFLGRMRQRLKSIRGSKGATRI